MIPIHPCFWCPSAFLAQSLQPLSQNWVEPMKCFPFYSFSFFLHTPSKINLPFQLSADISASCVSVYHRFIISTTGKMHQCWLCLCIPWMEELRGSSETIWCQLCFINEERVWRLSQDHEAQVPVICMGQGSSSIDLVQYFHTMLSFSSR